jgi:acetyl-CoA carboxylase biotin carboxylase subunit
MVVGGVKTTIPLFLRLVQERDIIDGDYNIHWLEKWLAEQAEQAEEPRA